MENVRITNSLGETIVYVCGWLAGVDTTEPYYWLSEDKREVLRMAGVLDS